MTWHSGGLLWLLLATPVMAGVMLWAWRARRRAGQRFGAPDGKPRMVVGRSGGLRATRAVLLLAGTTHASACQEGSPLRRRRLRVGGGVVTGGGLGTGDGGSGGGRAENTPRTRSSSPRCRPATTTSCA